jgi:hypothetical protein
MNYTNGMYKALKFTQIMVAIAFLFSCSNKNFSYKSEYQFNSGNGIPDYASLDYWAAHPYKKNTSDSLPRPLRSAFIKDSIADVFFIHPTTFVDKKDRGWNANIDNAQLNAKTDYSTILYQASVFNNQCRVFAPRYRQAHYRAFFIPEEEAKPYFDLAYQDVKAAFEYYLKNYNNGRPIIIASHSQGTVHAQRLLKEFFEGKPLMNKLICAYIIGMPLKENYFSLLKPCSNAGTTGCFVGWRTFKAGYTEPKFIANEKFKSIVVNPLTWTTDNQFAAASLNMGGILKNYNKISKHAASCIIHDNILWSSKPKFFGNIFLTKKNYHIADINLFYMNIRDNVKRRISEYYKNYKP